MSTSLNPLVPVLASLMEPHLEEVGLILEQLLLDREEMIPMLAKCMQQHTSLEEEGLEVGVEIAVEISHPTHLINPNYAAGGGPNDYTFLKDCVAQVTAANNKSLTKIVHCYLLAGGKEGAAEEYLKKVTPVSRVHNLNSIHMWNYHTLPPKLYDAMEDMGFGQNTISFFNPGPDFFSVPPAGWKPGQPAVNGNNPGPCLTGLNESLVTMNTMDTTVSTLLEDEPGIATEIEDNTSTAVEPNADGVVLQVSEVAAAESTMDAAAEDNKKKGVMEMEDTD